MDVLRERESPPFEARTARESRRPSRRIVVVGLVVVALVALTGWLWEDVNSHPTVYVVGDSITALSRASIATSLTNAGYRPTISATPGAKIGQAETDVTSLAQHQPWAWVIELGTDDSGARNVGWTAPFMAEWAAISPATCVVYVTVSPYSGAVGRQIDTTIDKLAQAHPNVHILDWGNIEYTHPGWVMPDGIHPTTAGQVTLAGLEAGTLEHDC